MISTRLTRIVQFVIIFILPWLTEVGTAKADINTAGPLHAKLIVRGSYLSGIPVLVRIEVVNDSGKIERGLWDAQASLSVDNPNVNLSTNKVVLYNGLGSTLVKLTGSGNVTLTAKVNGMEDSRQLLDLAGQPVTSVSGTLAGDSVWSGIIHITGNIIVPIGHKLIVQPDTLVLINGVSSGNNGTNIEVRGKIESLGTIDEPVTFTAFDPARAWGQIRHINATPSLYQYTDITRGGHSPGMGHTGAGPVIRPENSQINFNYCSITDNDGKIMYATGSDLTFRWCHFARSVMGPEIEGTGLLFEDGFINEMFGPDDDDGIYLIRQGTGQNIELRRGVIANCDDDGVDTLNSNILIEDFIIRDCYDKGVSVNGGEQERINHALIINNGTGVAAKEGDTTGNVHVYIDNATIVSTNTGRPVSDIGIHSYIKYTTTGVVEYFVTNSIILAADPVKSDFTDPDPLIRIDYSDVAEAWSGTGNINADPCFADVNSGDYHLKSQAGRWDANEGHWTIDDVTSPCIDAGDPASPIGLEPFPNGGIINMGAYGGTQQASKSYFGEPPCETIVAGDINGDCKIDTTDLWLMTSHWLEEK